MPAFRPQSDYCDIRLSNTALPQIAGKRWKVDLNARRDAALLLSAVNLPGGIQVTQAHC